MVNNQENIETEEYNNLSYSELSEVVRQKAKVTGKEFIPILYEKLIKEKKKPTEAKLLLEHDFGDIWSKTYINEFIPQEAKDVQKVEAGKKKHTLKKEILQIAGTNQTEVPYNLSAQQIRAEQASVGDNKPDSASFLNDVHKENYYKEQQEIYLQEKELLTKEIDQLNKELKNKSRQKEIIKALKFPVKIETSIKDYFIEVITDIDIINEKAINPKGKITSFKIKRK